MTGYLMFTSAGTSASGLTKTWNIENVDFPGHALARISWYAPWRKYVFTPCPNTLWDAKCLTDVIAFLNHHNAAHKAKA